MKKYHITITENETRNTQLDIDTDAIIAGIDEDESIRVIHATHCPVTSHAAAICGLLEMIEETRKENPLLDLLVTMYEKHKAADKETEEN